MLSSIRSLLSIPARRGPGPPPQGTIFEGQSQLWVTGQLLRYVLRLNKPGKELARAPGPEPALLSRSER